ncbi:uncharacterized protein LOC131318455 isoform X3 [Rhododendron vialii]|uniref:uncharacterized protein LOC131318455 isoform X2 n=1 Tax=Rhododendron vialii TaxID=182163 RepID=UPI00265D8E21|nr:uncharacterized protein LOC131318455 isoform X2 [Rhododendron vialii]XP_058204233.1 uncharacterized protein LOC131318455 isoform X3 [Rhododendron vialii]
MRLMATFKGLSFPTSFGGLIKWTGRTMSYLILVLCLPMVSHCHFIGLHMGFMGHAVENDPLQSGLFKRCLLVEDSNGQQNVLEKISLVTCARCRPGWGHEQKIIDTVQKSSCTA